MSETVAGVFLEQAERRGSAPFLHRWNGSAWEALSWSECRDSVLRIGAALVAEGVAPGDAVVLLSENRVEWILADLGIQAAAGVTVPVYATSTPETIAKIVANCQARLAIVGATKLAGAPPSGVKGGERDRGGGARPAAVTRSAGMAALGDKDHGREERHEPRDPQPAQRYEQSRDREGNQRRQRQLARPRPERVGQGAAMQAGGEVAAALVSGQKDELHQRPGGGENKARCDRRRDHSSLRRGAAPDDTLAEKAAEGEGKPDEEEPACCDLQRRRALGAVTDRRERAGRARGEGELAERDVTVVREDAPVDDEDAAQPRRQRLTDDRPV